jgi:hypothetical protein
VVIIAKKRSSNRGTIITGSHIQVGNKTYQFVPKHSKITNKKTVRMQTINGVERPCFVYNYRRRKIVQVVEDYRLGRVVNQPGYLKYKHSQPTMHKQIDDNLARGIKEIGKSKYEQSIALDFERNMVQPQRMVVMEGGKTETLKITDFELFGHTHPDWSEPIPSTGDLRNMNELEPEFLVAGKSGKIYIMSIEDGLKWKSWKSRMHNKKGASHPIPPERFNKLIEQDKYKYHFVQNDISSFTSTERGRELFYEETGIKLIPYRKPTTIELKDDPHLEKKVPTIPEYYLEKWKTKKSKKQGIENPVFDTEKKRKI